MSETQSHRAAKNKAAGRGGQTEVPLSGDRRLDTLSSGGNRATEVERSGDYEKFVDAARRLRDSDASQRVLQVPQSDFPLAIEAMKDTKVSGTVKNPGGTQKRQVRP